MLHWITQEKHHLSPVMLTPRVAAGALGSGEEDRVLREQLWGLRGVGEEVDESPAPGGPGSSTGQEQPECPAPSSWRSSVGAQRRTPDAPPSPQEAPAGEASTLGDFLSCSLPPPLRVTAWGLPASRAGWGAGAGTPVTSATSEAQGAAQEQLVGAGQRRRRRPPAGKAQQRFEPGHPRRQHCAPSCSECACARVCVRVRMDSLQTSLQFPYCSPEHNVINLNGSHWLPRLKPKYPWTQGCAWGH